MLQQQQDALDFERESLLFAYAAAHANAAEASAHLNSLRQSLKYVEAHRGYQPAAVGFAQTAAGRDKRARPADDPPAAAVGFLGGEEPPPAYASGPVNCDDAGIGASLAP